MSYELLDIDLKNNTDRLISCANKQIELSLFYTVSLGPAIIISGILGWRRQRKKLKPDCCNGRPGVVVPLNLLDEFEHRWSYAVAFGAITTTLVGIMTGFDEPAFETQGDIVPAIKVIWTFWRALQVCVNFFPFFACLYTDDVLLGAILGGMYCTLWFVIKILVLLECPNPMPKLLPYLTVVYQAPIIACLGFLVLKFGWICLLVVRGKKLANPLTRIEDTVVFPFQISYVQSLLRKPPPAIDWDSKAMSNWEKVKGYYRKYYYDSRSHFKFSTRIICTLMIIFMANYQMSVFHMYFSSITSVGLRDTVISVINDSGLIPHNSTRSFEKNLEDVTVLLNMSWKISTTVSAILFLAGIFGLLSNYRTNLLSLYRGDRSFCPPKYQGNAADYLANSMKYPGYQIAFAVWGNLILVMALLVVTILFSFVIILPVRNNNWGPVNWILQAFIFPLGLSMVIRIAQVVLANRFFLQQKLSVEDKYKPLSINNRRLYHVADYFFFVANVATGLFSCLMRIIKAMCVGLFYLGRLDRCVLMSGWEQTDTGFTSYLGMLEVEHAHNHPALRVFCHILISSTKQLNTHNGPSERQTQHSSIQIQRDSKNKTRVAELFHTGSRRCRAQQRWLLMYTLIRNPILNLDRRWITKEPLINMADFNILTEDSTRYRHIKAAVAILEMGFKRKDADEEKKLVISLTNDIPEEEEAQKHSLCHEYCDETQTTTM